ncbi:transposase [Kineococcus sp. DHX-1]|uniref:transposase n=1 Tax=Kineococcus sp. DHX-1 TaxID=3349638 RepID=UPI0036D303BC
MGSTRRHFTPEYKAQAVACVLDDHRAIGEVARNSGVHEMTLGKWVKKERESRNGAQQSAPLDESERAELERLRVEVRQARMEAEFAKKVASWFAKDQK